MTTMIRFTPACWGVGLAALALTVGSPANAAPSQNDSAQTQVATPSSSADPTVNAEASASADTEVETGRRFSEPARSPKKRDKWIYRWAPQRNMWELGVFGGVWFPSSRIELFDPNNALPNSGYQRLGRVTGELGLRAGWYPFRFLGVEAEGAVMPTRTRETDNRATAWGLRAHVVGQLGFWSITPFLLVGTGILGVSSADAPEAVGSEQDIAIHFGGGVKAYLNRWVQLRLDIRDVVSNRRGVGEGLASSPEILLGVSVTLGRKKEKKPRPRPSISDRDGDRVRDSDDYCPDVFGVQPRGCPVVCVDDNDGDGLPNPEDKCPAEPENRNGFEDDDGCPDVVPPELEDFAGVMDGINFDTDRDTIKGESKPILDNAVETMKKFPNVRVEIVGHTDSKGGYRHNMDLSRRRAGSVRQYLIDAGIDGSRIETRGAGPDEPIASNDTAEGRADNRRIEFKILER